MMTAKDARYRCVSCGEWLEVSDGERGYHTRIGPSESGSGWDVPIKCGPVTQPVPTPQESLSPLAQGFKILSAYDQGNQASSMAALEALEALQGHRFKDISAALRELLLHAERQTRADERARVAGVLEQRGKEIAEGKGPLWKAAREEFEHLRQRLGGEG